MVKNWMAGAALALSAAVPAAAQAPQPADADQVRMRQRISTMEGVLERAVGNGAENLMRQMRAVMPDAAMLTGAPRARGFRLDGYGIFFDVEVPVLRVPMTWTLRVLRDDRFEASRLLRELRVLVRDADVKDRDRLQRVVAELERMLDGPAVAARQAGPSVGGASLAPPTAVTVPVAPGVDRALLDDPDVAYTREVKAALVDAMLENSGPLGLGDDERLTVAARDNMPRDPLVPADSMDLRTVIFTVKGSDLAAFHARRLTLEEVRKRVEVREY
ncbi:MAG TPA: hypothetical protein VNI78_00680 [Vicinamibacterales bacterium]|nr:hypothetical protein [Vicinamibacterales bacterium]